MNPVTTNRLLQGSDRWKRRQKHSSVVFSGIALLTAISLLSSASRFNLPIYYFLPITTSNGSGIKIRASRAMQSDSSFTWSNGDNNMPVKPSRQVGSRDPSTATVTKATENHFERYNISDEIRSWGCERRHEAPFIFVHIGKAGGGQNRARLAASALQYNRSMWQMTHEDNTYYYPMYDPSITHTNSSITTKIDTHTLYKGILVNSGFNNFRPSYPRNDHKFTKRAREAAEEFWESYEKTLPCNAETPLGQAIACPVVDTSETVKRACPGHHCSIVYTGHNMLGNELHWLPSDYLKEWWLSTPWSRDNDSVLKHLEARKYRWYSPNNTDSTCHFNMSRKLSFYKRNYFNCVAPIEEQTDQDAHKIMSSYRTSKNDQVTNWSPIYASLPVLRVTMIREPFSWLLSQFFWHQGSSGRLTGRNGTMVPLVSCDSNGTDYEYIADWASPAALKYIYHLCGEDCIVRMKAGHMSLEQVEIQSRHNLLHSFAVVGLLNETQSFFEMIMARSAYMNTTLNPEVSGGRHSTSSQAGYKQCKRIYKSKQFQDKLLEVSPEIAMLQRLYEVGVRVNRFQLQEMRSCGLLR